MSSEAAEALASVGVRTSLRYAVHLLTPAAILAKADIVELEDPNTDTEGSIIEKRHVQQVDTLFQDGKTSSKRLAREAVFFME